jgi:uncharacterized protein YkwD
VAVKHWGRLGAGTLGVLLGLLGGTPRASAQGIDVAGFKTRVLQLLNEERAASGLPALRRVGPLESAAQSHSEAMRSATDGGPVFLSHTDPDGSSMADRVSRAGYQWFSLGENIAAGQRTPDEVVRGWMNSSGHRANILNGAFRDIGIGLAVGPGTWPNGYRSAQVLWWTTNFGSSRNDYPPVEGAIGAGTTAPVVTGYTATMGIPIFSAPPGAPVVIVGSNLGTSGGIRFGSLNAPTPVNWSPNSITVIVPAAPTYPYRAPVTVEVNGQSASGPEFTITPPVETGPSTPATTVATPSPPVPVAPPPPPAAPAAGPTVTALVNGLQQPISTARPGSLFLIRGLGFGSNETSRSRVLLFAGGVPRAVNVLHWSDETIHLFAPWVPGRVEVAVHVEVNGALMTSNRLPLVIQ